MTPGMGETTKAPLSSTAELIVDAGGQTQRLLRKVLVVR